MATFIIIAQLTLRNEVPPSLKGLLFLLLAVIAVLYVINAKWFQSLSYLALLPVQRFQWQSEQFSGNALFRGGSLALVSICTALFVYVYGLGPSSSLFGNYEFIILLAVALGLTLLKLLFNTIYFVTHRLLPLGSQLFDFQSSINQLFCLVLSVCMVIDVFYARMSGGLFYIAIIIAVAYFLVRLYGTILILQNKFNYPIVSLFVYLCTFEIAPALVLAKVLFVES